MPRATGAVLRYRGKRMKVKKLGLVVAVEIQALKDKYAGQIEIVEEKPFHVLKVENGDMELYAVSCGAGEAAAASAVQHLIDRFGVKLIANFGVVGGLTPEMKVAKVCVVESVVDYSYDTSAYNHCEVGRHLEYPSVYIPTTAELVEKAVEICPELRSVICASADRFVESGEEKRRLHRDFNADICEMEAAGIVLTANRNEVPCLLVKAVSDAMDGGAAEFAAECSRAAVICLNTLEKVIASEKF